MPSSPGPPLRRHHVLKRVNVENGIHLHISAAIMRLPGLNLTERAALAWLEDHPFASNGELATVLSLKRRGVEDLLRRLRQRSLIHKHRTGRARELYPTFHVEQHAERGERSEAATARGN